MTNTWPICDGSGRCLVEVDPDEDDGHVVHIFDPFDYLRELATLTFTRQPRTTRPQFTRNEPERGCP
jgi:hypothetical protein